MFRALEWRVWRFLSGSLYFEKNQGQCVSKIITTFKYYYRKNNSHKHFAALVFCGLLILGHTLFAADGDSEIINEYEYQTIKILPGTVTSRGWNGDVHVLSQEMTDNSLFGDFDARNSARVVPFEIISAPIDVPPTPDLSVPSEDSVIQDVEVGGVPVEEQGGDAHTEQIDTEPAPTPELEPEPEIFNAEPTPSESNNDNELQALSKSFFRFTNIATALLPLANLSYDTGSQDTPPSENQETIPEQVIESVENGISTPAVQEENPVTNDTPVDDVIVPEDVSSEEVEQTTLENTSDTEAQEIIEETNVQEEACSSKCYAHVLELGDFGVVGDDTQQITNMQLRVSLGARPHEQVDVANERIKIEYLHYDYWIDGGVIEITDEVSNAINGGYFLFGFPLYSEWEEMERIKVRLTYESDNEHISDIFVDSVWIEVESINHNAFNDPNPSPVFNSVSGEQILRTAPNEYYYNFISRETEFENEEAPHFVFDIQRLEERKGFLARMGDRIKSFFGFGGGEAIPRDQFRMRIVNPEFRDFAKIREDENGTYSVDVPKMREFKPGRHVITIEVEDNGNIFYIDQEFTWGVLALNANKSIYMPDEEAYLQMGVLDELGHTICDAKLELEIQNPLGYVEYLSTENGTINYGNECAGDTFTTSPDYDASYTLRDGLGTYNMKLTATTKNGTYTISDNVDVREQVPFDVVRTGPTRIYPPALYPVTLTITANEDYIGEIIEFVPASFQVYERSDSEFRTHEVGDAKQLIWDVDISAGETIELSYYFDAPDYSPEFYLLGPLTIGMFAEIREWQIASDAPSNATIVQTVMGTPISATSYSATFGTAPTTGNTIIMVAAHTDGASAFNAPASYLTQAVLSNATIEADIGIWYANANPATTTYSITKTGGNQTGVVYLMEVSGLDTTDLLDVATSNDQTGSNSRTAYTGATATSTEYGFAVAGIIFADNDFNNPTSGNWTSDSANTYTQNQWTEWATGNDGSLGIAYANVNVADTQGATLTVTGGGSTEQRNNVIAIFNLRPQINTVGARGNQVPQIKINTANNYVGGAFTIATDNGTTSVTSITVSEAGTTNAAVDLSNIRLKYELDSVAPYDCASATYDGTETQYGATSTAFSSANGTSTFSGAVTISTTSAMCIFTVLNVDSSATAGHTLELQISNPSTDVVTGTGSTSPATAVSISDTSTLTVGYSPSAPMLLETPSFVSMRATTTQPTFGEFVSTDADGDVIEYEFSIDDDPLFASPATTTYSTNYPSDAGWASTTFASGATTTYRVQQALTPGTTYWWRVRGRDPFNTNMWGQYSVSRSITIGSDLNVPEWYETTDAQFASTTSSVNATTSGNSIAVSNLDTSVSLLDAWSTGNTKTISSGTDRVLVVAIISEDSGTDVNVNTVTFGGQTLTEITDQQIGTGFSNGMWVGYLSEAGIASSSGTTITPTWTGSGTPTPNGGILYASAVFAGVDQSSIVRDYSSNALTAGTLITPASSVSVLDGDYMFYISETEDSLTHTPETGYTEGTEEDTGGVGFVAASAYKAITADGSEYPTATWSASGNRLLMVAVALRPTPAKAVIMSTPVDFDWVSNQNDWGEITWDTTETSAQDTTLRVYYGTSTSCSTLIPDGVLPGNTAGFIATTSPIDISGLATSTYNRICLQMTLSEGTATSSPTLDDWKVSWELSPLFEQISYRWYVNTASATPTNTWPPDGEGTELLENEAITNNRPVEYGDVLRLRLDLAVSSVAASGRSFKLQFAEGVTCDPYLAWTDVGPIGSTTALWRGYDNAGLSDGATLASAVLSSTDALETYEEENNSAPMPNSIAIGNQGEWDWVLESRANAGTSYCFRVATPDGNPLATYTQYPLLVTNEAPAMIALSAPFDNEKIASTSPWFEFMALDAEGNTVDYQIQIDNDVDFGSAIIDTDSITNVVDFSNTDTPSDKSPFNESETIRYAIPSSLTNGNTYWWRVRSVDMSGSQQYGEWSSSQSFTIDTSITIATWFQTTEEQFDTDTLVGTDATASDLVAFASGSTTGTTTSTSIDFDNGRSGNAWGEFIFTETGSANDILYHIEYYDGSGWTLIPDTDLTGNNAGFDTSPVDLIDLDTATYNEIRIRANFRAGTPTLNDWTVTWGLRVSVPTHLLLFDNEKTGTTSPAFTFFTTDPEGDDVEYQMSWSTDKTFATGSTTVNSSTSAGFVNVSNGLDTNPFNSGDTVRYTMQTPLSNSTTYWWRVRAKDPNGGNSYSFWSDPWSFTTDTTATTSTWFQTTKEQFETDALTNLVASTSGTLGITPAGVTTYTFAGITNPSATHIARDFEVDVQDPTDPPTFDEIDTITTNGTAAGMPNLRTAIAGYASDAEATNAQYTNISTSNNVRWTITDPGTGDNDNAVFWASFLINEDPTDITQIEVNIEGYQAAATDKAWLGIWRPGSTTPYWQNITNSMQTSDYNYTGTITTNIDDYFDGNNRIHIIFFNEDKGDSIIVDYVDVKITTGTADAGTVISTPIDFDDGSGPAWGSLTWSDSEPGLSTITYQVQYLTGASTWALIPDAALAGNSTGFTSAPVNLNTLNTTLYNEIRVVANFDCVLLNCPTLNDWTVKWSPGFTISGTAFEYDGVSSTTSGTVEVAVNGVLQTGKTGSISGGYWSINNVTFFDGDVVTVFVSGAADADEAVAVTVYDGTPDMPGMRLQKRHLTIGSDDHEVVTNTHLGLYDYTQDEDLFFNVNAGNDLTMCADVGCGDAGIAILALNTYSPGTGADVVTHDMRNDGSFTAGANTIRVSGSWDNNATTTMTGSTVIFTATTTSETIDSTGATVAMFNNVTLGETSGTATWTPVSTFDVDSNLSVQYGTLSRGGLSMTISGNLTVGSNGLLSGIATTTFDGTNPSTITDQSPSYQNLGYMVVDGTAKTALLGSSIKVESMTIGSDDSLDVSTSNHDITVYRDWLNNNTFTARAGEVIFGATTTNRTITVGGDSFYDLTFNGVGGAWSFTEAVLGVGNDFRISTGTVTMPTGTTTLAGSWNSVGGTFAHNNSTLYMTSGAVETISASGTPFTNNFYNITFGGGGSWSFLDTSATTSNDIRIQSGTVTFPSNTLSVGGYFANTGGTFAHNNGTVKFTAAGARTIDTNASFNSITFSGSGSWSFTDASVTALGSLSVAGGTLTLPSGTMTLGGSFSNTATVSHNNGTILFNSTDTGETISIGSSSLYNMTFSSATGGWTITAPATTTNNVTISNASSFVLQSGQSLSVGGTFTNSVGGASTTWTGSILSLEAGNYSLNTKTNSGDVYETLVVKSNTDIKMWNSSAVAYSIDSTGSLYSQDHAGSDGDLYIFGSYERTSGNEYWSYATDFDGTALVASTSRQVDVRFANGGSALISGAQFEILGSTTASTTIQNQGSGTYTVSANVSTTTFTYYDFNDLGASGVTLSGTGTITSLNDGAFTPATGGGTGLTVSSSTIDSNPGKQIYRVEFSTTTAISATNVTQTGGAPTSYWWFRESVGNIDGEYFDNDTGDPGSVRWDDSSLTIIVSGTVFSDDGTTPMGNPTCDGSTSVVRVVVNGGTSYTGSCASGDGTFTIGGVVIIGDPVLTVYLDTNGGAKGTVVTRTPTADITDLDIYANRVMTRHEDTAPLTILNMALYDHDNDSDITYIAATGTLAVLRDTELHIASSTTFDPQGAITVSGNASGTIFDGSLHIDDNATLLGYGSTTITLGGSFTMDQGATFSAASTTVLMNATTTGKTITTTATQEITFNDLVFNGIGGGWNINGDVRALSDIDVTNGTVSGTGDITVVNGSLSGDGLLSMGSGTTTIYNSSTLGGTTSWTFGNLVLGSGSVVGTTTPASNATTTVLGKLTINTAHFLNAQGSHWNLAGTGNVFVESGTFLEGTSTVRYSGSGATNVLSTTYYDLDFKAQGGSPTYSATGLGIIVTNDLTVGGATTTTINFDTSDPALDVNGDVFVDSTGTFIGSASASTTIAGSWDNIGTFTGSGGTVTFDNGGTKTIAAGNSPFSNVRINGAGSFTVSEHATATGAFTIQSATSFTLASGQALSVGGAFTNEVGGAATTWTGSSLFLYGGGNYTINTSAISDSYDTFKVANGTHIRMWQSNAASYDVHTGGSLYSQDHSGNDGDLYIFGSYAKTTGNDYWSYGTDFDGTALGGSSRNVDVYIGSGANVLYTGGGLSVIGTPTGTTTIQNQGSGTYTLRIGGTASTSWSYYRVRDTDTQGLTFSGTPSVTTLSYGNFEVTQNGGSALTVGGTVINQNQAKTFTTNYFGVSGASPAYNVTATGTTISSWRFTNHNGALAGESNDVDPGGDPGYVVWDDSTALVTIGGKVYSDEGATVSGVCDDSTSNIHLRVAGLTSYTASCASSDGAYSMSGVVFSPGDSIIVYIDGETEKAATVSEDLVSSVSNMDLYENRVIVRHEGIDPLSIADMSLWDSSDDADIPFTAIDGAPDTLTLPANTKLIVWTNKEFEPNGNMTLSGGGGGAAYDGTLELYNGAVFDAAGAESHSVGGSMILGTGASLDDDTSTFTFTTTGAARTIDTNEYSFYNVVFNGSGSWTIANTAFEIGNDLTLTLGALTLPSGTTTVSGSLAVTGGSFNANGGTMLFNSSAAETINAGGSSWSAFTINGTGSFALQGTNATATRDVLIENGTLTSVSGLLTIGGDFINDGTFTHNNGTLRMIATSSAVVTASSSDLGGVTFAGAGAYTFTDEDVALIGSLTIQNGSVMLASGTMSIAGSFVNSGGTFNHASGTLLFNSSDVGETINSGSSIFNDVSFGSASGGWTISSNATTTGNFSLVTASNFTLASSTRLVVNGVFTNLVGGGATTWTGSTIAINSGTGYTINTKTGGGDVYNNVIISSSTNVRSWDSAGTITMGDTNSSFYSQDHAGVSGSLYIYGNYVRTTGSDYWSYATDFDGVALGGSSRQAYVYFAQGASTTLTGGTLNIVGANGFDTTVSNQGSGTYGVNVAGGTFNALYYSFGNLGAQGLSLSGTSTISSLTEGNFTLAVSGGSLITLSSTTLNQNAGLFISGVSFATTTAITGYNVNLVGTTPSAWTFTGHTGNLDGEFFDNDGGDDCSSIRWDDSECLLTQQSAYRFRNDDGGEGVPNSEWYDTNWSKRKRVTVTNGDAVSYTNATVKLNVTFDSDMQTDFDDLRFTSSNGTTQISHFIEKYTASTEATVWVKIPLLATSTDTEIYMYYGNGGVSDGGATTTFSFMDNFEDGNTSEYSGDTAEFTVVGSSAYERTYRLEAADPTNGKTDVGGMYNNSVTVSQGETLRFLKYIDTGTGSADEVCTLFGTQNQTQNYAVCLELFGVDRMSLAQDVLHRDTSGTVLASTTVTYSTGWYEVEVDWGTDDSIFVTLSQNGIVVATTSATDNSYSTGGVGYTLWGYHGGWDIYSSRKLLATTPTTTFGFEQVGGGASWLAGLNTPASGIDIGDKARVRFLIENTGLPVTNQNYEIEFAPKGVAPSCESVNPIEYVEVPNIASCGTSEICMETSSQFTNLASTTDILGGEGTFTYGQIIEDPSNNTGNITIDAEEYTELEYVVTPTTNVTDSSYCLRVSNEGTDLDSYTKVAELGLRFAPNITSIIFNDSNDITLLPGTTTRIYATGTVTDLNGYTDLGAATTTFHQNGLGGGIDYDCAVNDNNCYRMTTTGGSCSYTNCSGDSCDIICYADIYYHANATDVFSPYPGDAWTAYLEAADLGGSVATNTSYSPDLITLRALSVDENINYGTFEANADSGTYNASSTVENIGNDSIDISVEGTNLTDGGSSVIPVGQQRFATSTFTYSACTVCSSLAATPINYKLDLSKPTSTVPSVTDQLFWGIAIPFGVSGAPHQGTNTFYAIDDF